MKSYIVSIAVCAVLGAVINMIAPDKWNKYISIVTGLVIVVCITRPIVSMCHTDVFSGFDYQSEINSQKAQNNFDEEVKKELAQKIEGDIKLKLKKEFGKECEVRVEIAIKDGKDVAIEKITLFGDGLDSAVVSRVREEYGASEVELDGNKKTSKKQE